MLSNFRQPTIIFTLLLIKFSCVEISETKSTVVDIVKFKEQNLLCHNKYREKHGVKALAYNDQLHKIAQNYAEVLAAKDEGLIHSVNEYGENLYASRGILVNGLIACDSWYDEIDLYDFAQERPDNISAVGHFTQMVWKGTCFMGVGLATAKSGWTYIVANYDPMGNVDMKFRTNVLPLGVKNVSNYTSPFEKLMNEEVVMCTDADNEIFLEQNLECHNIIRKKHGAEPLSYDEKMNQLAQEEAVRLAENSDSQIDSKNNTYGRNVFSTSGGKKNGFDACKHWYEGSKMYEYDSTNISSKALAFTQMVWKSSHLTGIGFARSKEGAIFTVGFYDPPGNFLGEFKDNVLPPVEEVKPTTAKAVTGLTKPLQHKEITINSSVIKHNPEKSSPAIHTPVKTPINDTHLPPIIHEPETGNKIQTPHDQNKINEMISESSTASVKVEIPINQIAFRKQNIECHNEFRRIHEASPLSYEPRLNMIAQEIASHIARTGDKKILRSLTFGYNLYSTTRQKVNGTIACKFWYKRSPFKDSLVKHFDPIKDTLPFTQLVWKSSKQTGIGVSKASSGKTFVIALYDPPGNIDGLYKYNVSPPRTKKI